MSERLIEAASEVRGLIRHPFHFSTQIPKEAGEHFSVRITDYGRVKFNRKPVVLDTHMNQ